MRATISFEAEVDRVNDVMLALSKQETDSIRSSAHVIETAQPHEIHEKINVALEGLYKNINQLEQYRDMLVGFERARFSTLLPQEGAADQPQMSSVREVKETMESMRQFGNFIESINDQEQEDDNPTKEG